MSGQRDDHYPAIHRALTPSGWKARATPHAIEFFRNEPVKGGEFEIALRFIPERPFYPPAATLRIVKGDPADFPWHRIGDSLCHFDSSTAEWDPESIDFPRHVAFIAQHAVDEFHRLQQGRALTTADMEFAIHWAGHRAYLDIPEADWPSGQDAKLECYEFVAAETHVKLKVFRLAEARGDRYRAFPDGLHRPLVPAVFAELEHHPGPLETHWPPSNLGDLNALLHRYRPKNGKRIWVQLANALWDQDSDRANALLILHTKAGRFGALIESGALVRKFRRKALPDMIQGRSQLTRSCSITRWSFERLDDDFVLGRNEPGKGPVLAGKKIHLVGLGAIGATLAERLVQAGAGRCGGELHLFDFDVLKTENLGRHLLGAPYLGMPKVTGVARYLERNRLATNVFTHDEIWQSPAVHEGADLVVDATAMPNIGAALSNASRQRRSTNIITAFIEGEGWIAGAFLYRGVAGEACRTCWEPWPGGAGANIQQSQAVVKKDNGCGSVYTPYRAAAADMAAALAAEMVCEWATGKVTSTYRTIRLPQAPRHAHGHRNETPASKTGCVCAKTASHA